MAVNPSPFGPKPQFEIAAGTPAVGNKLFFYVAGSVGTKQNTYTSSTGLVANTNPIILDSLGFPTTTEIWFTAGQTYKVVYAPSTDTDPPTSAIWTIDNLSGINDSTLNAASEWVSGSTPAFASASTFTLVGDQTVNFHIGRRLKATVTAGTVYGTITASAFAASTTVTVAMDSGQALDSGMSAVSYALLNASNPSLPDRGTVSPAQVVANQNNWTIASLANATVVKMSTDARRTITGLAGGADGKLLTISNVGTFPAVFSFEDALSTAANRFTFGCTLGGGQSMQIQYDSTSARWRAVAKPEPLGKINDFAGSTMPADHLAIDQNVSRTTYASLFNEVGTIWGVGDGSTTFGLFVGAGRALIAAGTGTISEAVAFGSVSVASDNFTVVSNDKKWITGQPVVLTTTGGLPAPLALATTYYIVRSSATLIQFATTLANAQNGTVIDITTQGTGTHTVTGTLTARTHGELLGMEDHPMTITQLLAHIHAITDPTHFHASGGGVGTGAASGGAFGGNTAGAATGITINSAGGNQAMNNMQPSAVVTRGIRYC